jgi:hypothetical protein
MSDQRPPVNDTSRHDPDPLDVVTPGRMSPRECIGAARDALNRAYATGQTVAETWHHVMAAVDWQRRALEQLAPKEAWCKDQECPWKHSRHYHEGGRVHAPGQAIW